MSRYLTFLFLGMYVYALVDLARSPKAQVRLMPKMLWAVVILILGVIGVALWFVLGRPRVGYPPSGGGGFGGGGFGGGFGSGPRGPSAPLAPDDDPEFLKQLDEQSWRARMEQLRRERQAGSSAPDPTVGPDPDGKP
jgi:hypothetical protein